MTNSIFNTKEQYFSFRDAWKSAVNNDKAKSHLIDVDEWLTSTDSVSYGTGKHRVSGWIEASHSMLFNILCGRPIDCGFMPVTNKTKLENGTHINHGLYYGYIALYRILETAKKIRVEGAPVSEYRAQQLTEFLAPFNNTVTIDMLAAIKISKIEPLHSDYGKSKQVAAKIINGEFKPINFQQFYDALEEVA